jgi:hypothetical protein
LDVANFRIGQRLLDELHRGHPAPDVFAKPVGIRHLDFAAGAGITAVVVPTLDRLGAHLGRDRFGGAREGLHDHWVRVGRAKPSFHQIGGVIGRGQAWQGSSRHRDRRAG